MSDASIKIIPENPAWRPSAEAAEASRRLLASFVPGAESVSAQVLEEISFVDPGANWSGVECSACGADASGWWSNAVEQAYESSFADLGVTAACCGARVSLNNLRYIWPAGFASFVLEAKNPNVADLSPAQEAQIAACMGSPVRKILVHV